MMTNGYKTIAIAMTVGLGACTGASNEAPLSTSLAVDTHTSEALAGSYDTGDMVIDFQATTAAELVAAVDVAVGETTLSVRIDAAAGSIDFESNGVALAADQVAALAGFAQAVEGYLGRTEDPSVMHESALFAAANYFAKAPVGTALVSVHKDVIGLDRSVLYSTGNDGKTCIRRGATETAKYDGDQGTIHENWVVGSSGGQQWNGDFDCMGRCGAGCGGGDWTLDCLDHDSCSRHYYSSTGALDHNCGDEYSNAADDYLNFWKRCRG